MNATLRIATRKSALALWQANHVRDLLLTAHPGIEVELVKIVTKGDRILDRPLADIGGKGLFLKELERAMLDGHADLAVHSMKDVPAVMADGLVLDAVLPRANPYDALVSREGHGFAQLPAGSRVGTSSLRRRAQLLAQRPELEVLDLRGNVDTRLAKLDRGDYDAVILACAGLERLGLGERVTETLKPPAWLPASTQGIIGLQCRADDPRTRALIKPLADDATMFVANAERAVAQVLEATCQVPLAVHAVLSGDMISLQARVDAPDGSRSASAAGEAPQGQGAELGRQLAGELLAGGAAEIMAGL
ncbi:MAG: hydroxymethylbilane synthase [Lysobacterales bacterium]|jgi:hydroxymethylbilane synthase